MLKWSFRGAGWRPWFSVHLHSVPEHCSLLVDYTTDLIYSEERQIYSEVFLARHDYRHMSEKLRTILECHSQHD
jgi:hypothetical protein